MKAHKDNRAIVKRLLGKYYFLEFVLGFHLFAAVLVPFFTEWGGISLTQVQVLQSIFMLGIFLLEVPTGVVADRIGRKHSMALGAITMGIGALLYGTIPNFSVFVIAEILFAAAVALQSGADEAWMYDTLKERGLETYAKVALGHARSAAMTGMFIAAPIGGFIAHRFGLNVPMLLEAFFAIIAAVLAWSLPEPKIVEAETVDKNYFVHAWQGTMYLIKHKTLRILTINRLMLAAAAYFVLWLYQPVLSSLNTPIAWFGVFHLILVVPQVLILRSFDRLEKMFRGGANYLTFVVFVLGLTFVLVAAYPSLYTLIALLILGGGMGLTRHHLINAYMHKFIPSNKRATIMSASSMARRSILVVINPMVGFMADRSLGIALFAVGCLAFATMFVPIRQELLDSE
jgi:MFS family permease